MGVEIRVDDLTKSFGKQLIWGDVTLTVPAGEICVMLGPSGTVDGEWLVDGMETSPVEA